MAVAATTAVRAWILSRPDLKGPIPRGAFLAGRQPRSPAHGGYVLLSRDLGVDPDVIAEDSNPTMVRISMNCFAGTIEAAEAAANALSDALRDLSGCPVPCGTLPVLILCADHVTGPGYVSMMSGGEQYLFSVAASFMLLDSTI